MRASEGDARAGQAQMACYKIDAPDDFEFTLTLKALRQIQAEAWEEGASVGLAPIENPYRKEA